MADKTEKRKTKFQKTSIQKEKELTEMAKAKSDVEEENRKMKIIQMEMMGRMAKLEEQMAQKSDQSEQIVKLQTKVDELGTELKRMDKLEEELKRMSKMEDELKRMDKLEEELKRMDKLEEELKRMDKLEEHMAQNNEQAFEQTVILQNKIDQLGTELKRMDKLEEHFNKKIGELWDHATKQQQQIKIMLKKTDSAEQFNNVYLDVFEEMKKDYKNLCAKIDQFAKKSDQSEQIVTLHTKVDILGEELKRMGKMEDELKRMSKMEEQMAQNSDQSEQIVALQMKIDKLETERPQKGTFSSKFVDLFNKVEQIEVSMMSSEELDRAKSNAEENRKMKIIQMEMMGRMAKLEEQMAQKSDQSEQIVTLQTKIDELETEQRQKVELNACPNAQKNYWDNDFCNHELKIIDCLTVHRESKRPGDRSVYAKHPILLNNDSPANGIFYFEITIIKKRDRCLFFGFASKKLRFISGPLTSKNEESFAYSSNGKFWVSSMNGNARPFDETDVVGCGVNLATRQIFFTKNGKRMDAGDLYMPTTSSSSLNCYFPFVSLINYDDKIEANFGDEFKFNLTNL